MPFTFTSTGGSGDGTPGANGKDSFFLGTWNSVTAFLAAYQGGPVGLADGDWWAFVKDNENPNKIYVVREDPNSATGWVIDDNEHFVLPVGADGADGNDGAPGERGISALSWTYKAQTGVVNVDPGNDYLNFNADPFTSSTQIRVDDNPYGLNTTLHDLFLSIQSGYLSVTSQSDPSSYATFEIVSCVDGTATNETLDGSYVIFNVSLVSTYGAISNEDFVTLSLAPGSGGTANTGDITFDGVKIIGAGTASGDGYNNGTIDLVPDANLITSQYQQDQYLIIDPTAPNHIHIRAGGTQDASTADLFLGAERTGVQVSDGSGNVIIRSKNPDQVNVYANSNNTSNTEFIHASSADILVNDTVRLYTGGPTYVVSVVTQEYPSAGFITITAPGLSFISGEAYTFTREQNPNIWIFGNDGTLSGPAMGGVKALGLLNSGTNNLELFANDANIVLQAPSGSVDISAPEININSISVPSSLNINTYLGAIVNSNRTSTYAAEDKVVATLGDLPTGATGTFETSDSKLVTVTNGIITSIDPLT
jgi:hypothetical protein